MIGKKEKFYSKHVRPRNSLRAGPSSDTKRPVFLLAVTRKKSQVKSMGVVASPVKQAKIQDREALCTSCR
jgi:hypothetical protein